MKKWVIGGVATVALVGTGLGVAAYAQGHKKHGFEDRFDRMIERVQGDHRGWHGPRRAWSADDRAAFMDARIAAVKAGLKLTPEQEKLWGPVENTMRELGKKYGDRMTERRAEWEKRRAEAQDSKERPVTDHLDRIRKRAEFMAERAGDLKRFADAAQPLYATLDEAQKRRLESILMHQRASKMRHWRNHDRDDGPRRG